MFVQLGIWPIVIVLIVVIVVSYWRVAVSIVDGVIIENLVYIIFNLYISLLKLVVRRRLKA